MVTLCALPVYAMIFKFFAIDGPLKTTERFAYDNRYVYTRIGSQLYRTASPCPARTRNLDQNMFFIQ